MFGVLQMVFGQDAVAGGMSVTGQLLIFFVDGLGGASHLYTLGPIGIEGAVGVVLRFSAIAAAISAAPTLTLHTLEISHVLDLLRAP
jgi:hypothetical protein